jgi:predicted DNA-binding WGR domain protein
MASQIATALDRRGGVAETDTGQSRFRCDVAVRSKGADRHQLAILVDGEGDADVMERFHTRPEILRAFGWQVITVMAKDWWHEPESVLERIERLLRHEIVEEELVLEDQGPIGGSPPSVSNESPPEIVPGSASSAVSRFEFTGGKSNKFWSISQEGPSLTIRFGRIGTAGQVQVKTFADSARAERESIKLIAEKAAKGYVQVKE